MPRYGGNLSVHKQMNKESVVICIQWNTTSDIKKNEVLLFAAIWMNLEGIIVSKVSQRKTNTV